MKCVLSPEGVGALGEPGCPGWCRDEALSWCSLGAIPRVGSSCSLPRACPAPVIPLMAYVTCQKPPKVLRNRSGAIGLWPFLNTSNSRQ